MINRDRTCYDCSFVQFWRASGHGGYGYSCDKYTGEITKKDIRYVDNGKMEVWHHAKDCDNFKSKEQK